jgi:hypothetical protein
MKFLRVGDSSTVSSSFEGSNSWQLETEVGIYSCKEAYGSIVIYETYLEQKSGHRILWTEQRRKLVCLVRGKAQGCISDGSDR